MMTYSIDCFHLTHSGRQALTSQATTLNRAERLALNYVGSYHKALCVKNRQKIQQMFERMVHKVSLTRLVAMKFLKFHDGTSKTYPFIRLLEQQQVKEKRQSKSMQNTQHAIRAKENTQSIQGFDINRIKQKKANSTETIYINQLKQRLNNSSIFQQEQDRTMSQVVPKSKNDLSKQTTCSLNQTFDGIGLRENVHSSTLSDDNLTHKNIDPILTVMNGGHLLTA